MAQISLSSMAAPENVPELPCGLGIEKLFDIGFGICQGIVCTFAAEKRILDMHSKSFHNRRSAGGLGIGPGMSRDRDDFIHVLERRIGGIQFFIEKQGGTNGNIRTGSSDYFVTEACEYTNSFLSFFPRIGMILNIEEDHLDFFKDLEDIRNSFHKFAKLLPADGCLIINGAIDKLQEITGDLDCRVITFNKEAVNSDGSAADYYPSDITYDELGYPSFTLHCHGEVSGSFSLQVPGEHNVCNAVASIALADLLSIDRGITVSALHDFTGTDRRFEYKGTIGGVTIIDDYAHHPTEIAATLHAAANYPHKTLWCVFQPHTYTRTKAFMKDFAKALSLADKVVLADIYAARETDTLGISSETLQAEIQALGHECYYFPSFDEIENFLLENCINGDLLITMGAGDVVKIGENLLGK